MSVHFQYLKHLQCRHLCTLVCVGLHEMPRHYEWDTQQLLKSWENVPKPTQKMCVSVLSQCYTKRGRGAASQTHVGQIVYDQIRSEGHDEPGYDPTALFTVMHSSVSYLKLERFNLYQWTTWWYQPLTGPSPLHFPSGQFWYPNQKVKIKPNSHRNTCKHILHNVLCRGPKWGGWKFSSCLVFWGLVYPPDYTHYGRFSWMEWALMLNLHDS